MKRTILVFSLVVALLHSRPLGAPLESSRCHLFVDYENIWTLEMVQDGKDKRTPILNIITFTPGEWGFRPEQVQIVNKKGKQAKFKYFSLDTGVPEEPYRTKYVNILGNSFIGLDLQGKFDDFGELSQVTIDLGESRFELELLDCAQFDAWAEKINRINFESPDVKEDFYLLKIEPLGRRGPIPKGRR